MKLMKILIIQQKFIGDVLMSSVLCENLKIWNPKCEIDFIVNDFTIDVLKNNPHINKLIVFKKGYSNDFIGLINFALEIRKKKYDYLIDAYSKLESNLVSLLSRANFKISYYKTYSSFIYNKTTKRFLKEDKKIPLAIKNRIEFIKEIVDKNFDFQMTPKMFIDRENSISEFKEIRDLKKNKKTLMIIPLGSNHIKSYPIREMAKILNFIGEKGDYNFIFNYMEFQKSKVDRLFKLIKNSTKNNISTFVPKSLNNFINICNHCDAVIGNEGGAIHMAKGLNKATFAIFSPMVDLKGWHVDNNLKQVAVHYSDYSNDFLKNENKKLSKVQNSEYYKKFKFSLFKKKLDLFLDLL